MTLTEYVENLNAFYEQNPHLHKCEVWTADDDEGNGFTIVSNEPIQAFINATDRYRTQDLYENNEKGTKPIIILN